MIIYKKPFMQISYNEPGKLVEVSWHGYVAGEKFRSAMLQYGEVIQQLDVNYWLGDYRQSAVVRIADQEWMVSEWGACFFPHVHKLQRMARVHSYDISARISAENMFREIDFTMLPFAFRQFEDYGQARSWLLG